MTQKYNLSKYERAAQRVLSTVGISPQQLGLLEKLIKLEEDKSHVRKVSMGFAHPQMVYGFRIERFRGRMYKEEEAPNAYLKNLHLLIDINVNSTKFAYKNYVKKYLKKKKIPVEPGKLQLRGYKYFETTNKGEWREKTEKCPIRLGKLYQEECEVNLGWSPRQGKNVSYKTHPVTLFRPCKGMTVSVSKNKRDKKGAFPAQR